MARALRLRRAAFAAERESHLAEARSLRRELAEARRELVEVLRVAKDAALPSAPKPLAVGAAGSAHRIEPPALDVRASPPITEAPREEAAETRLERAAETSAPAYDPLFDTPAPAAPAAPAAAAEPAPEVPELAPDAASEETPLPVETQPAPAVPDGERPMLTVGCDDIPWMSALHTALGKAGFHPGDEDMEEWLFGEGTANALLYFQACNDLEETGYTDNATWDKLLGAEEEEASNAAGTAQAQAQTGEETKVDVQEDSVEMSPSSTAQLASALADGSTLGTLCNGDGGEQVRLLHVLLGKEGFYCGEDDMEWWQFGDATENALRTFQETSGVAITGTAHGEVWRIFRERYDFVEVLSSCEDEFCDDMTRLQQSGAVYLLGEGRWEIPEYVRKQQQEDQ